MPRSHSGYCTGLLIRALRGSQVRILPEAFKCLRYSFTKQVGTLSGYRQNSLNKIIVSKNQFNETGQRCLNLLYMKRCLIAKKAPTENKTTATRDLLLKVEIPAITLFNISVLS